MIALWQGELPLSRAFWEFAILYGLVASMASTAAAALVIFMELPVALAVVLHFVPAPYLVACAVGVWRSAGRYGGAVILASAARAAVVPWVALMLVV